MRPLRSLSIAPVCTLLWLMVPGGPLGAIEAARPRGPRSSWLWSALRAGAAVRPPMEDSGHERWPDAPSPPESAPARTPWSEPLPGAGPWAAPDDPLDEWDLLDVAGQGLSVPLDDGEDRP